MKPIDENPITLCCPKCGKQVEASRLSHDPLEAIRMESTCPECWEGDFVETKYFDATGAHITNLEGI
jgi:hypothetical protein